MVDKVLLLHQIPSEYNRETSSTGFRVILPEAMRYEQYLRS